MRSLIGIERVTRRSRRGLLRALAAVCITMLFVPELASPNEYYPNKWSVVAPIVIMATENNGVLLDVGNWILYFAPMIVIVGAILVSMQSSKLVVLKSCVVAAVFVWTPYWYKLVSMTGVLLNSFGLGEAVNTFLVGCLTLPFALAWLWLLRQLFIRACPPCICPNCEYDLGKEHWETCPECGKSSAGCV